MLFSQFRQSRKSSAVVSHHHHYHNGKSVSFYQNHRQQQQQQQQQYSHRLRNPIIVFCLSFLVLGSLRLRAVKTKQQAADVARNWIERGRQRMMERGKKLQLQKMQQRTIAYELDYVNGGNQIQRYRAVWVQRQRGNLPKWTRTKQAPVSVKEWTQVMLDSTVASAKRGNDLKANSQLNNNQQTNNNLLDQFIQILQSGNSYPAFFFETKGVTPQNASTKQFEFVLVNAPQLQAFVSAQAKIAPNRIPFGDQFDKCTRRQHQQQQNMGNQAVSSTQDETTPKQESYLSSYSSSSCVFENLGRDAILVAPKPLSQTPLSAYGHLASFVRQAPYDQVYAFWIVTLQTYLDRLQQNIPLSSSFASPLLEEPSRREASVGATNTNNVAEGGSAVKNTTAVAPPTTKESILIKVQQQQEGTDSKPVWLSTSGMGIPWLHMRLDQKPKYYSFEPFARES